MLHCSVALRVAACNPATSCLKEKVEERENVRECVEKVRVNYDLLPYRQLKKTKMILSKTLS